MNKKLLLVLLLSVSVYFGHAQFQGCPGVDINGSSSSTINLPCGQTCTNLTANVVSGNQTTTYTVAPTSYNPFSYNGPNNILINIDDTWSAPITLPFNFCFFGTNYNQVVVGSNGVISFNTGYTAGSFCQWQINNGIPSTANQTPVNSIMGPWHDIDPSVSQPGQTVSTNWGVYGTAPCRAFVVSWTNVPMYNFGCNQNTSLNATHQIVIYETTNLIDIFIQNKSICSSWNSGRAIEGIQNANGTTAVVVPGRNYPTQWTASNDAWRFTPAGAPNYVVNWFQAGNLIGTGTSINVCPAAGVSTTYTAQATYTNCDATTVQVSATADVFVPQQFTAQIDSGSNVLCFGDNSGAVYASVSGQPAGTTFGFTPGGANQVTLNNIGPGTYIFNAVGPAPNGCSYSDTFIVSQPPPLIVNVPDSIDEICIGPVGNNTGLTSSVAGGVPGYSYLWSSGQATPNIGLVPPGTYTLVVTDANGCTQSDTGLAAINIVPIQLLQPAINNIDCFGETDGSISLNISPDAVQPVTYSWAGGQSSTVLNNLPVGSYSVTATDFNGCSTSDTYQVTGPAAALSANIFVTNITCNGLVNGAAAATVTGGTTPYAYQWSNGSNVGSAANLPQGPISLTVTDFNACSVVVSGTVTEPSAINTSASIVLQPCTSPTSADITITASGGSGSYTFNLPGFAPNATGLFNDAPTSLYNYTVTDGNNCSVQGTVAVPSIPDDVFNVTATPTTCPGTSDGSISVTALISANGPYQFSFEGGAFSPTSNFNNLDIGTYLVVAQNANGCFDTLSVDVQGPVNPLTALLVKEDISCAGLTDGSASISASGGTPVYTYAWSNGSTATTISGLSAGNIAVTVTDANGCSVSASAGIVDPSPVTGSFTTVNNFCAAQPYADATITASGGTGALTYSVNGFASNSTGVFTNLPAGGNYNFAVTDNNGCSYTGTISVPVYTPDVFTVNQSPVTCFGFNNGAFEVIPAIPQNGPYQYVFNGGAPQASGLYVNVGVGTYQVQVTNNFGCTQTVNAEVTGPAPISIDVEPDTIVIGAGAPVNFNTNAQGFISPVYNWTPVTGLSCTDCASPTGTFNQSTNLLVTVSEAGAPECNVTGNVVVVVYSDIVLPNAFTPNNDGLNEDFSPIVVGNTKINALRIYNRWGELVHEGTNGWDGRYKGQQQPAGTYNYFIDAEMPDKDNPGSMKAVIKQGQVTIIR